MTTDTAQDLVGVGTELPISPLVNERLLRTEGRRRADFNELVRVIQTDQALTLRLLRIVNSPFYGLRGKVNTLSHAVAMLGPEAVERIVRHPPPPCPAPGRRVIDPYFFWQHALTTAVIAEAIAKNLDYDIPEEAYLAGLLHDVGKLVLERRDGEAYAAVAREMTKNEDPVLLLEERRFGAHHAEVGAGLAARLNLPATLVEAIRHHHRPPGDPGPEAGPKARELAAIVTYADFIAWSQGLGSLHNGHIPVHNYPPRRIIRMLQSCLEGIMDEVNARLRAVGRMFHLQTTGIYDFHTVFRERFPRREVEPPPPPIGPGPEEGLTALNAIVRELRRLEGEDRILDALLRGIHERLGFDRVLHFRLHPGRSEVVGRRRVDATDIPLDVSRVSFVLGIDEEGISRTLMSQRPGRLTRAGLDARVVDVLGVAEVVVAPLVVHDRTQGVILADNFLTGRSPAPELIEAVGLLCLEASLALENRQLLSRSRELQELAERDELTQLANRRFAIQLCRRELERARREQTPVSVVMVDIDHFKRFNDTYGHQAGDFVLREVARRIQQTSEKRHVMGRYGGEEFLVLLPETPLDRGIVYAERLRSVIEDYGKEIKTLFPACTLTVSAGVTALRGPDGETLEAFLARADRALYSAKERGRNRVCVDP